MSDPTGFRRYASTVAVFATVLYAALLVAVSGVVSLLADIDVVSDREVGIYAGTASAAGAAAVVLAEFLIVALRIPKERQRIALLRAFLTGVVAYLGYGVVGAVAVLLGAGDPVRALVFLGAQLTSVFGVVAGVLGFLVAVAFMLVLASRMGENGPPRWPWEKDDD